MRINLIIVSVLTVIVKIVKVIIGSISIVVVVVVVKEIPGALEVNTVLEEAFFYNNHDDCDNHISVTFTFLQ